MKLSLHKMVKTIILAGLAALAVGCASPVVDLSAGAPEPSEGARDIAPAAGTVTVSGYVRDASGNGVNSVWVVVTSVPENNPNHLVANKAQVETKTVSNKKGYYSVTIPNRGVSETGTILVFANTYKQRMTYTHHVFQAGVPYKFDITADKLTTAPNINYIGLRESYYGLTRPSVKNWPTDLTPVGTPALFAFNDRYADQVQWWSKGTGFNWSQTYEPTPTHVLIVTQTEPNFRGEKWDSTTNGITYVLWEKTATDATDAHLKYLGSLKSEKDGSLLNNTKVNLDALLSEYDAQGHQTFIQLEAGHFDATKLIDMALKRFYLNSDGSVRHPSICGVGMDIEWYKDTNAPDDGETVTAVEVNKWEAQVQGYNPNFKLFVKHWDLGQGVKLAIPKVGLNKSVILINDSQSFDAPGFAEQKKEFKKWLDFYSPNPVGFQIGYPGDKAWWTPFANPVLDNAKGLRDSFGAAASAREIGFVWVDFSVRYAAVNKTLVGHTPTN